MRLAALAALAVLLLGCSVSLQEKWVLRQANRCNAMGGTWDWDEATLTFECYRHPIGRQTKLLYSEKYNPEGTQ